ncbi:galectin-3-binding protein A-like [Aplochiton taeniatus]
METFSFRKFKKADTRPREGEVRLTGSQAVSEGRVEVYHDGKWGTVCDDNWDLAEAQVVCRQLQFTAAKSAVSGGTYGEGSGPIWLDDLSCKGTEKSLSSCPFKGWGETDCSHKEDAGVVCETGTNSTINDTTHFLDHSLGLSEELGQLFDTGDGCNLNIVVRSPTGNRQDDGTVELEEKTVCAHRLMISRFPFFNASNGTSSILVDVSQACRPHFRTFIRYLYTRQIDVSLSSAQCLHQMASEYGVKQLMQDTGRLFTVFLPVDSTFNTQVSLYDYGVESGDMVLQENCLQFLAWNYQDLIGSPAWKHLSVGLLQALLSRSDLVVRDEAFLFESLETWISEQDHATSVGEQANLLGHIRFPMIPAEKLYDLQFNSKLYKTHEKFLSSHMLRGYQFNVLLYGTLKNRSDSEGEDYDYQPRIYTSEPWGAVPMTVMQQAPRPPRNRQYYQRCQYPPCYQYLLDTTASPYYRRSISFSTPVHNSMIFQDKKVQWEAHVFLTQHECSQHGFKCDAVPTARLTLKSDLGQYGSRVGFSNRLLLTCKGRYIGQVQDFKNNIAQIPNGDSQALTYPCAGGQYEYRFVVRPEYI